MIKFKAPKPEKTDPPRWLKVGASIAEAIRETPEPPKAKFDRNAYQREYMRKKRAALKAAKETKP